MAEIHTEDRPWERLRELANAGDSRGLHALLDEFSTSDAVRALLRLSPEDQDKLLTTLLPSDAAELIDDVPDEQAADLVERLPAAEAASILEELDSDDQADLIADIEAEEAEAILAEMAPEAAKDVRRLVEYDPLSAGGLMMTEVFVFQDRSLVGDVLDQVTSGSVDFERYRGQHPYIVSANDELVGVVSLRSLLLSNHQTPLTAIMTPPRQVAPDATLEALEDFFHEHPFLGVPVVDEANTLLGVVSRAAVAEAALERADADQLKVQGIVGDELRSMPVLARARRRLSWLSINIVLNIIAASVIAMYEETLAAMIALAVFLPIVSDMSGCSGNQAVAVSLRELTLGIAKPIDVGLVWLKEVGVGLINGLALGLLLAIAAWAWKGNPALGLVVGGALAANTVVAVSIGGTVPLILKRFGVDPAVASGPILTTVTDMVGFFLVLSFAAAMLPLLTAA
ncbi:MAG: magnesium transporter [Alphaproteobacteria bacterium]|nr:magnesium transporter [Alphaproteobacteria bacterium]